jgi:colanic acid/amylovoran biosynthesis glycosyltransferase
MSCLQEHLPTVAWPSQKIIFQTEPDMKSKPSLSRLYYAAGPGDIVTTFRHWLRGEDDPREFARTYSGQFFDLASRRGARALVVSHAEQSDRAAGHGITVRNRPLPAWSGRLGYYGRQAVAAARLWADVLRFRPSAAIVAEGTTFWTLLLPLRWMGFRIVPTLHCLLHRNVGRVGRLRRLQDAIERASLRLLAPECLTVSAEIEAQLAPGQKARRFFPSYRGSRFSAVPAAGFDGGEFRLLYAGRIEDDKGVFDLLHAVARLRAESPVDYRLEYCGGGDALDTLRNQVAELGLGRWVTAGGHCAAESMRDRLAACHVVVVPTTSRFLEGFNKVIVEGVYSGRPVVATSVCPSASLFGQAVRMVAPDSPDALAAALRDLAETPGAYAGAAKLAREAREATAEGSTSWEDQCGLALDGAADGGAGTRVGYLVPKFPDMTHAFFWREVRALRESGVTVRLISTARPRGAGGPGEHPFAAVARRETHYLNRDAIGPLIWLLGHPVAGLRALGYVAGLKESRLTEKLASLPLLPAAVNLCRVARRESLRHIHIHSCANAAHLGALARRLDGLSYSLTLHGDLPVYGKDHASKMATAAFVSTVTRPLRGQVLEATQLGSDQVPVITMGVDVERFTPDAGRGPNAVLRIATVARLIPQKGHLDALKALSRLAAEGIAFRYTIAGDGPERESLESETARLGLGGSVEFAGRLGEDAVRDLLRGSDVLLLPSYGLGEAAPVCVMEAMACGLVVVCSRIGGTPDMISHGTDGFLVPQQDTDLLADTLRTALTDEGIRAAMGRAARLTAVEKFDHRATAARLRDAIDAAIS